MVEGFFLPVFTKELSNPLYWVLWGFSTDEFGGYFCLCSPFYHKSPPLPTVRLCSVMFFQDKGRVFDQEGHPSSSLYSPLDTDENSMSYNIVFPKSSGSDYQ